MNEIMTLFSFSESDQEVFTFAREYSVLVARDSSTIESNRESLIRYMLVYFLVEYLATNHQGEDFSTILKDWSGLDRRPQTKKRLELLNMYLGKEIESSEEYIALLYDKWPVEISGQKLFNFVLSGQRMG